MCAGFFQALQFELGEIKTNHDGEHYQEPEEDTKGILWWFKWYILDASWMNYRISKPLGNCLTCMASVYSFVPYWYYYKFNFTDIDALMFYPVYILILAGMNRIIDKFIND